MKNPQMRNTVREERNEKLDSIGFVWDGRLDTGRAADTHWDTRFEQLVQYQRTHGHCDVPKNYELNRELGHWVSNQRRCRHGKKSLRDVRVAKLMSIGFRLSKFNTNTSIWNTRLEQLIEYKRTHGNFYVPRSYERNQELARWVSNQRVFKNKNSLSQDRVAQLESIGFVWDKRSTGWDIRFAQLVEYNQIHGNCAVPSRYEPNKELGRWVVNLRRYLDGTHSMPKDRVAKLKSLGFTFADTGAAASHSWDSLFEELRDYLRTHGDCNVPEENFHCNPSLGNWVSKQRHDYEMKCAGGDQTAIMTAEHEAKLNLLGFSWVRSHAPASCSNDNNSNVRLCPDKVTSESLPTVNRQRTNDQP
jgi:hypothetical protein